MFVTPKHHKNMETTQFPKRMQIESKREYYTDFLNYIHIHNYFRIIIFHYINDDKIGYLKVRNQKHTIWMDHIVYHKIL